MKRSPRLFLALAVFFTVFLIGKDFIARVAIVKGVKAMTGVGLGLGKTDVALLKQFLRLQDLKILNPPGFKEETMAYFPEINIAYDLLGFLKGKAHFKELKIDLKEFFVLISENGAVNIKSLKAFLPKGKGKSGELQIESLNLKVGKVIFRNYSSGKPVEKEFNINLDENIKNIQGQDALVNLILSKSLSKTSIPSLANLDLSVLKEQVLKEIDKSIEKAVGEGLKNILPKGGLQ